MLHLEDNGDFDLKAALAQRTKEVQFSRPPSKKGVAALAQYFAHTPEATLRLLWWPKEKAPTFLGELTHLRTLTLDQFNDDEWAIDLEILRSLTRLNTLKVEARERLNLEPLQHLPLEALTLVSKKVTTLKPLNAHPSLKNIGLQGSFRDHTVLTTLKALRKVDMPLPKSGLEELEGLDVEDARFVARSERNIDALASYQSLKTLSLVGVKNKDLSLFESLDLHKLNFAANPALVSLEGFADCARSLSLGHHANFSSLSGLSSLSRCRELSLFDNKSMHSFEGLHPFFWRFVGNAATMSEAIDDGVTLLSFGAIFCAFETKTNGLTNTVELIAHALRTGVYDVAIDGTSALSAATFAQACGIDNAAFVLANLIDVIETTNLAAITALWFIKKRAALSAAAEGAGFVFCAIRNGVFFYTIGFSKGVT